MVTPESLIQPQGPIAASLFPDDTLPPATGAGSLLGRLQAYIDRAVEKVSATAAGGADPPVRSWASHLAFDDAHTLASARYNSETLVGGLGAYAFNSEQLKALKVKADYYANEYEEKLADAGGNTRGVSTASVSRVTPIAYDW